MTQEKIYNENQLNDMIEALQNAMYKLESIYNSHEDREDILWDVNQLTNIENFLINLKTND
jgi:hypothetical protein